MTSSKQSTSNTQSAALFDRACKSLVGGVNSPVRAFRAVGGEPVFVERAVGPHIFDVDGNRYVDLVGSWGPAIVGHSHPKVVDAVTQAARDGLSFGACCAAETELAELILSAFDSCDRLRFVNSGTEAVMSALRLARAATGRDKIVKFQGCYHGHADAMLVAAGSGAATFGSPDSAGVTQAAVADTLLADYNDLDSVETIFAEHSEKIAAVLVEPIAGNMGMIMPDDGFLPGLRSLCDQNNSLLLFDEVMTGFRVSWGGYQNLCGVTPDLTCLGKVIGGGLPVAAYAGRRELMEMVSPLGPVYQAGTLSGNPLGMAAGMATLELCRESGFYENLNRLSARLADGLREAAEDRSIETVSQGGMAGLFFSDQPVRNFADANQCDHKRFSRFFQGMLKRGIWLPPSPFEAMFVSAAHGEDEIDMIIEAADAALRELTP